MAFKVLNLTITTRVRLDTTKYNNVDVVIQVPTAETDPLLIQDETSSGDSWTVAPGGVFSVDLKNGESIYLDSAGSTDIEVVLSGM